MHPTRHHRLIAGLLLAIGMFATACTPEALAFSIGDCVNLPDGEEISDYESVDCDEAHDAEVFALPQHPDGGDAPFPGVDALNAFVEERCRDEFEPYVGIDYDSSAIFFTALSPGEEAWDAADDREVVCLLVGAPIEDDDGQVAQPSAYEQLTGVKRDSAE